MFVRFTLNPKSHNVCEMGLREDVIFSDDDVKLNWVFVYI